MSQELEADACFVDARLAELYDPLDADRSDLEPYAQIIDSLGARKILDVGCGTGTFACQLAARGLQVTGVDPAGASLAVAGAKPQAPLVQWVHGTVADVPTGDYDVAVMTANVAMVFTGDLQWQQTLERIAQLLKPGGRLIFEARRPEARAWLNWTPELTRETTLIDRLGPVSTWIEVLDYADELLSFRETFRFEQEGSELVSHSTLRYRTRQELTRTVEAAGFSVQTVQDAPDRPGRQFVFIARRDTSD
ncbi:class I SAM-dependent methyltransferase [Arthrobacter sp. MYb211]|uniref:class I SAM-dependent methyltransferase n=1 Tax=Micrococcaceae TaxID=1268 RepID=UPI000BB974AB|nr:MULTISPECIES: class I SAM-dependent methyltransferase [Micrococcaceae]PCC27280.1 SAM-dependent methyltransferase [Glutamicibacter sp. BW80]PRA09895.1 class I SAM-dependent methyltransferase [Arthrobacter sp. MYb221]PRC04902.1 class I SAM-dependent methyltransferase [Arthrobacter sp. MYb211]